MACGAGIVIGSFDEVRGRVGSLDHPTNQLVRGVIGLLLEGESFRSSSELTPQFLNEVDVLALSAYYSFGQSVVPLSASEQDALFDFVRRGGNLLLTMENIDQSPIADASHESFLDPFGMSITGNLGPSELASQGIVTELGHPIFRGPLGNFSTFEMHSGGWLDDLGPHAHSLAESVVNQQPLVAVIERNALGPGSGRVVVSSDTYIWQSDINMTGNLVLYLAVPEPDAGLIAVAGGALILFAMILGRRNGCPRRRRGASPL